MKKYILVIYMMAAGCTMLTAQTKGDYLPTFIRKHRSQRQFIITGRELVRKEVPVTMSFRFIFLLL